MKLLKTIIFLLLILASCNNEKQKVNTNSVSVLKTVDSTKFERGGNEINYDSTKVLYSIVIIDRKGSEFKENPSSSSKSLGIYVYGKELEVIEENEHWLGIRDRITREYTKNGNQISSSAWEKVFVLKSSTGSIDEIKLLATDVNIISSLTKDNDLTYFEEEQESNDYLKVELIDKRLFFNKKDNAINYITKDTSYIKKKNGVISLKCVERIKKYIDKPDAEESRREFKYVGQVDFLNQYLIEGSYWESIDYTFIDKESGNETQIFNEYPHISENKKYIICAYANPYEMTADIELYSINDNSIKSKLNVSYKNWMPSGDNENKFWHQDGYFYLSVNHIKSFWKKDGDINNNYQYVRIKTL